MPNAKKTDTSSVVKVYVLIVIIALFVIGMTMLSVYEANPTKATRFGEEVATVTKSDTMVIKDYIKQRNKTIPIEVCNIIADKIIILSEREKLPADLIVAMIETESSWNPTTTSDKGAKGLMQILEEDGITIESSRSYDIEYNIKIGIDILKSKLKKTDGNLSKALKMYVGGDKNYSEKVYQAIGMFVMYKAKLVIEEREKEGKEKSKR